MSYRGGIIGGIAATAILIAGSVHAAPDPADTPIDTATLTSPPTALAPTMEPPAALRPTPSRLDAKPVVPGVNAPVITLPLLAPPALTGIAGKVREALETSAPQGLDNAGEPVADAVRRFYAARDYKPVWVNSREPLPRASSLVRAVLKAAEDGLEPANYFTAAIQALFLAKDQAGLAKLEAAITWAFVELASDLASGRTVPSEVDPEIFVHPHDIDPALVLADAASAHDVQPVLSKLAPQTDGYRNLKAALARYREIKRLGGWTAFSNGKILRPGMRGPRVAELRQILAERGEDVDPESNHYDLTLISAVKDFQRRHGLTPDGAFGPNSRRALNQTVEQRIEQIVINMERLRWMPDDLGERYAFVNLADFQLEIVFDDEVVYETRVVVGTDADRTPVFSDRMTYLVLNPYWNIPPSIAKEEMLPQLQADPYSLARKGIRVFASWASTAPELDPGEIDWFAVNPRRFPYKLRQDAGGRNALGRVKFMFPNKFNIYLHDTPSKSLFNRTVRTFSHGCIRVEEPFRLAKLLLRDDPRWTEERVDQAIADGKRRSVSLPRAVNVHLTYLTAWVDRKGMIQFRGDVYKRDASLTTAIDASRRRPAAQAVATSG
jgi:murein L,D-transpeptidase YcbB/YkuD